jgi:hypothetical protein
MSERQILEIEVARHEARVAELNAALQDLQDNAEQAASHQAALLRMELKGRSAAVAVGSARLKMLRQE